MAAVETLLDQSIVPAKDGYVIHEPVTGGHYLDLSKIDFEGLKKQFEQSRKHIAAQKMRALIDQVLQNMVRLNRSRLDYYQIFQEMIDEYNRGAANVDAFFAQLVSFAQELSAEEQRGISENLTEEELAIFDFLTRPDMTKLTRQEKEDVKQVAHELLDTLKAEKLVLDWRKKQQTRAGVQLAIAQYLDKLPQIYTPEIYQQKCQVVYQHVYDAYYGEQHSIYAVKS